MFRDILRDTARNIQGDDLAKGVGESLAIVVAASVVVAISGTVIVTSPVWLPPLAILRAGEHALRRKLGFTRNAQRSS